MKLSEVLNESSLSRIMNSTQQYACGGITAYRGEYTKKQNQQRNKSLLSKLLALGYSVTGIQGSYIENYQSADANEVVEHSYWVVNRKVQGDDNGQLENDLKRLGAEFDQDSILSKPHGGKAHLVGTSSRENSFPTKDQKFEVGTPKFGKDAEFMSKVGNRPFTFSESAVCGEMIDPPTTINGIRGVKIAAERNWELFEVDE